MVSIQALGFCAETILRFCLSLELAFVALSVRDFCPVFTAGSRVIIATASAFPFYQSLGDHASFSLGKWLRFELIAKQRFVPMFCVPNDVDINAIFKFSIGNI